MEYYIADFRVSATPQPINPDTLQLVRDVLSAMAGEAGFESFEDTDDGLRGYVQKDKLEQAVLDEALADFPIPDVSISYTIEEAENKDWNTEWEETGFDPITIDDRCVIHDLTHLPAPTKEGAPAPMDITIDARQAFGTGTHETTRLIVSTLLDMDMIGKRVLDCGCGTGILSIVASRCGAKEVVAYDIDEWSVENTQHNMRLNHADNIEVLQGNVSVLSHVSGLFDVVMANINRNILLEDMPCLKEAMTHGGILILSGFYVEDGMMIAEKAGSLGMRLLQSKSENNWCMLSFCTE